MVEEAPGIKRADCATELASITALSTHLKYARADQGLGPGEPPSGMALSGSIMDLRLQDLQGAVEHRRVLSFAAQKV